MSERRRYDLILTVHVMSKGLAWVLFEGPTTPVDWGIAEVRGVRKRVRCIRTLERVMNRYRPDGLVVEHMVDGGESRAPWIGRTYRSIADYAEQNGVPIEQVSADHVRAAFAARGAVTKYARAKMIAEAIPCLGKHLPPARKPWQSEDARFGLFEATSLVCFGLVCAPNSRRPQ